MLEANYRPLAGFSSRAYADNWRTPASRMVISASSLPPDDGSPCRVQIMISPLSRSRTRSRSSVNCAVQKPRALGHPHRCHPYSP
jgi:hypothetical protein